MNIRRYTTDQIVTSTQNGFVDLLDWLGFLCSKDYLHDTLVQEHHIPSGDAVTRAAEIIPHVRVAAGFIEQSLEGPRELAFLPAYYAILNLSKIYVLFGPQHQNLATNRWHGASYNVNQNNADLLAEQLTAHPSGVFPLFVQTITGQLVPPAPFPISMSSILPCVQGISFEYGLATGSATQICLIHFRQVALADGNHISAHVHGSDGQAVSLNANDRVPALPGFVPHGPPSNTLVGPLVNPQVPLRSLVRTHLLIRRNDRSSATLLSPTPVEFAEEIPIWLLFYYLSSIVRYKPEFFGRLRDSVYWPMLSAARLHTFLDFLLAFWSFVHQKNYFIIAPHPQQPRMAI